MPSVPPDPVDPSTQFLRRWRWVLLPTWAVWTVLIGFLYGNLPPCPDHSVFDYTAWVINNGGRLYFDAADHNFPGMVWIHQVSDWLFGNEVWGYRAFDYVVQLPVACGILWFAMGSFGRPAARWWAMPIYQGWYVASGYWSAGQRDFVVAPLCLLAAAAVLRRARGGGRGWLILEGFCLIAAGVVRPTLLILAPILILVDLWARNAHGRSIRTVLLDHTMVAVTCLGLIGLLLGYGWLTGYLDQFVGMSLLFNLEVYSASRSKAEMVATLFDIHHIKAYYWQVAVSAVGILIAARRAPRALVFLGALFPAYLLSWFVQGKGLGYHLSGFYALHAMMMALVVDWGIRVLRESGRSWDRVVVAGTCLLVLGLGIPWKIHGKLGGQMQWLLGNITLAELRDGYATAGQELGTGRSRLTVQEAIELAGYIAERSEPGDTVLFWGRPRIVNHLAGRRSPLRASGQAMLTEPTPDFSRFEAWRAEAARRMDAMPPVFVILLDDGAGGYVGLPPREDSADRLASVLWERLDAYEPVHREGMAVVLQRK